MDLSELFTCRRTIRRYRQEMVSDEDLRYLIDMARHASCASNKQPLRYIVVREREAVKKLFDTTAWAGLVAPRRTPEWGKDAPLCFIAVTVPADAGVMIHADAGAAIQSIELAAWTKGLGCCWLASFDPSAAAEVLGVEAGRKVLYLTAVGYPAESPAGEDAVNGQVAYYLDEKDQLHVPKRPVDEITRWK